MQSMTGHFRGRAFMQALLLPLVLAVAASGAMPASRALAVGAYIHVDTLDGGLDNDGGSGDCSLAEAIENANHDGGGTPYNDCDLGISDDSIVFDVAGTITLSASLPAIADADNELLTIDGGGSITIDGVDTYRVLNVGLLASVKNLVVQNSHSSASGANYVGPSGTLRVEDSTFYSGSAPGNGGGIYLDGGTLNVLGSTFDANDAGSSGGALYVNAGTATVTNSTFRSNSAATSAGAVYSQGNLNLYNDTFHANSSPAGPGATLHVAGGATEVYNSILGDGVGGKDCYVAAGTLTAEYDLVEVSDASCSLTDGVDHNIVGHDPGLASPAGSPLFFNLEPTSPAIDSGDNSRVPGGVTTDQGGHARFQDVPWVYDTGNGAAPIVEMGSVEHAWNCVQYPTGHIYVDEDATGAGNGTSWANAINDLELGLELQKVCFANDVWVAEGKYKPDGANPLDRTLSFIVPPGAKVHGGFAGGETLLAQSDPAAHVAVLSGDIDDNDANHLTTNIDTVYTENHGSNSYHVVQMNGSSTHVTESTVLDGFTITGGRADAGGVDTEGGGLLCRAAATDAICSPTLTRLNFSGNLAIYGGALYNEGGGDSSPTLTEVTFVGNHASSNGGAVFNYANDESSPSFTNVTFVNNSAGTFGGAIINAGSGGHSDPDLTNVTFQGNAASDGGAIFNFGYGTLGTAGPTLTNVTFQGNSALAGGAIKNDVADTGISHPMLTNVILWNDVAPIGHEIVNASTATATITNSLVQDSGSSGIGWDSALGTDGGNNLDADPLLGALADHGGFTETMALGAGSPAIDAGDDVPCTLRDQRGLLRPNGAHCDIGAYEYDSVVHLFADVPFPGKEWMEPWIIAFYNHGITTGCGGGPLIYCPENNVTRAEMAVFVLRSRHGAGYTPPAASHFFLDVPVAGKEWMEPWIDEYYREGMTTGCGGGNYCPENNVTRAEMAVFVLRSLHGGGYTPPALSHFFSDMPVAGKEWMEPWVDEFKREGITTGCGGGMYCPENNVTRAEMAVFIGRAYGFYP